MIEQIIIGALLVEAIVETIKAAVNGGLKWQFVAAIVVAIVVAVAYGLDLFASFGLQTPFPYVGSVLSGVVIARGSNILSELITKLRMLVAS